MQITACLEQLKTFHGCFSVFFTLLCDSWNKFADFISVLFQLCGHHKSFVSTAIRTLRYGLIFILGNGC